MKIGELSCRTGVPTRMLRYYEKQGLLEADRQPNGYRDYPEEAVSRVEEIRGLIASGIPTRIIRCVLRTRSDLRFAATCSREFAAILATELRDIEDRIACLTRSRATIQTFLEHASRTHEQAVIRREG